MAGLEDQPRAVRRRLDAAVLVDYAFPVEPPHDQLAGRSIEAQNGKIFVHVARGLLGARPPASLVGAQDERRFLLGQIVNSRSIER